MQGNSCKDNTVAEQHISLTFVNKQSFWQRVAVALNHRNVVLLSVVFVLIVTLLIVVFWLPKSVDIAELETDPKAFMAQESEKPIEQSPWRENQLAKYRRQAQEILDNVLQKQSLLETKQVKLWAQEAYNNSLQLAASGDLFYRNQEFDNALNQYQKALTSLQNIEQDIEPLFLQSLSVGEQALAANNADLAKQQLQIAIYLKPNEQKAKQLFDRALVLDQVIEIVRKAEALVQEQQLDEALKNMEQAYELDANSPLVITQKETITNSILQRDYSQAMSTGYQLLGQSSYQQAITAFKQALTVIPKDITALQAIEQSKNAQLQATINQLTQQAEQNVEQENWPQALKLFKQIEILDPALVAAKVGSIKAKARADLEQDLLAIVEQPARLANLAIYQQAKQTVKNAKQINQTKIKLQQQISAVEQVLQQMTVPILITVQSDNQTQVQLYRNGALGNFIQKQLSLTPGEYILVGSRDGYRDVRQTIVIEPNAQAQTITIQCTEKIGRG